MELNIHLFVHLPQSDAEKAALAQLNSKLDTILTKIASVAKNQTEEFQTMQIDVQNIIAQAKANHDIEESAVNAINDIATKLQAALNNADTLSADDKAALQAELTSLQGSAADLGAAIATGDPATVNPPASGDGSGTGTGTGTTGTGTTS